MKRSSKTTPEQLAAGGLVEYEPGRFCAASDPRAVGGVKQYLTTVGAPVPLALPEPMPARLSGRGQWAPYRNKTEHRFAAWLATWCDDWHYEKLKFALGTIDGKESWYTPDFVRVAECGDWVAYEVKGIHRFREKGIERLRNAASRWPGIEWWLAEPNASGGWSLKRVEG